MLLGSLSFCLGQESNEKEVKSVRKVGIVIVSHSVNVRCLFVHSFLYR